MVVFGIYFECIFNRIINRQGEDFQRKREIKSVFQDFSLNRQVNGGIIN